MLTGAEVLDALSGASFGSGVTVALLQVLAPLVLLRAGVRYVSRAFR